jgi:hypothetical protein
MISLIDFAYVLAIQKSLGDAGWSSHDIDLLCARDGLSDLTDVLLGYSTVTKAKKRAAPRRRLIITLEQASALNDQFMRTRWHRSDLLYSSDRPRLIAVRNILRGDAVISKTNVISDSTGPSIPRGWQGVTAHNTHETFQWRSNLVEVVKITHPEQIGYLPHLNACALDYLLSHRHQIPDNWPKRHHSCMPVIAFFGTTFRNDRNEEVVRGILWDSDGFWDDIRIHVPLSSNVKNRELFAAVFKDGVTR